MEEPYLRLNTSDCAFALCFTMQHHDRYISNNLYFMLQLFFFKRKTNGLQQLPQVLTALSFFRSQCRSSGDWKWPIPWKQGLAVIHTVLPSLIVIRAAVL